MGCSFCLSACLVYDNQTWCGLVQIPHLVVLVPPATRMRYRVELLCNPLAIRVPDWLSHLEAGARSESFPRLLPRNRAHLRLVILFHTTLASMTTRRWLLLL